MPSIQLFYLSKNFEISKARQYANEHNAESTVIVKPPPRYLVKCASACHVPTDRIRVKEFRFRFRFSLYGKLEEIEIVRRRRHGR